MIVSYHDGRHPGNHKHLTKGAAVTAIESITLEAPDPAAASAFYTTAFGLGDELAFRTSDATTTVRGIL